MKLKELHFVDLAEIQEAVTDELKKVQKRNFRQLFRNCMAARERERERERERGGGGGGGWELILN